MNLTILGGTGFLGRELIYGLRNNLICNLGDVNLTIASRNRPSESLMRTGGFLSSVNWMHFSKEVPNCCELKPGELLIDAAMSSYPEDYTENNHHLIQSASGISNYANQLGNFDKYVYLSSGAVYGKFVRPHFPAENESEATEASIRRSLLSPEKQKYANLKLLDESFLNRFVDEGKAPSTCINVLRLYSVAPFLPMEGRHFALCDFIDSAKRGFVSYNSHGHVYRSIITSDSFWRVAVDPNFGNQRQLAIHNVCASKAWSLWDLAQQIAFRLNSEITSPQFNQSLTVDFYAGDNSNLRSSISPRLGSGLEFNLDFWLDKYLKDYKK